MKIQIIKCFTITVFFSEDLSIGVRKSSKFSLFVILHLKVKFVSGRGFSISPFKLFVKINYLILNIGM